MQKRDFVAVGSWVAIGLSLWIVSWIIAEAIPVFNNLLSLMVCAWLLDASRSTRTDFLTDGAIRQLVLSRDSGNFLAVYELSPVVFFLQQDSLDVRQSSLSLLWDCLGLSTRVSCSWVNESF